MATEKPKSFSSLVQRLKPLLRDAGATCHSLEKYRGRAAPLWGRLPLFTPVRISGEEMQPYLQVKLDLDIAEFVWVYEAFIELYLATGGEYGEHPVSWLTRELRISKEDGMQLFSIGRRRANYRDLALMLIPLAALAVWNFNCDVEHYEDTFQVAYEPYEFGILKQRPLSNLRSRVLEKFDPLFKPQLPRVSTCFHSAGLASIGRGITNVAAQATDIDIVKLWVSDNGAKLGEHLALVKLLLGILRWRAKRRDLPELFQDLTDSDKIKAFASNLPALLALEGAEEQWNELRLYLVPTFITRRRFNKLFGEFRNDPRKSVSQYTKTKWRDALSRLAEGEFVEP